MIKLRNENGSTLIVDVPRSMFDGMFNLGRQEKEREVVPIKATSELIPSIQGTSTDRLQASEPEEQKESEPTSRPQSSSQSQMSELERKARSECDRSGR